MNLVRRCSKCGVVGHNRRRCGRSQELYIGMVFNKWTLVVIPGDFDLFWDVQCRCGVRRLVNRGNLTKKLSKSCGQCNPYKPTESLPFIHGKTNTPTWESWMAMRRRAGKHPRYLHVRIHPPWNDFLIFLRDVGDRPPNTSIDRFPDRNGDYIPGNVRWATRSEQQRNRNSPVCRKCSKPFKGHRQINRQVVCP